MSGLEFLEVGRERSELNDEKVLKIIFSACFILVDFSRIIFSVCFILVDFSGCHGWGM